LLENGADVEKPDVHGSTPLLLAVQEGQGRAVQVDPIKYVLKAPGTQLLKLKHDKLLSISLQFCFQSQLAPLHQGEMARALLENGADVEKADEHGWTPLICALENTFENDAVAVLAVVRALLENGADVEKDLSGDTPLHIAVQEGEGDVGVVQALVAAGAAPNETNGDGATPLHVAVELGHVAVLLTLLDAPDVAVNLKQLETGWTPLHIAAGSDYKVGRCRLTVSNPLLKAPTVSALEAGIS